LIHSVKISKEACQGCVNCIKVCPTEAIRVIDGEINIIAELCIDCGECLRSCSRNKALGISEDDWNSIDIKPESPVIADPVFFTQFGHHGKPEELESILAGKGINVLVDDEEDAFDLSAFATAQLISRTPKASLPFISVYCPSVLRLIESRFPELLPRVLPVRTPIEMASELYKMRTNGNDAPQTLLAPCPSKITMIHEPQGVERSPFTYGVTVRRVARGIMAEGGKQEDVKAGPKKRNNRWIAWARRGGESRHVQAFSEKKLAILSVSGMRNTLDLLQELELGRLRGVDFIECRVCDTGCVGGVGTADSRFLANLRLGNIETKWEITPKERARVEELYSMDFWPISKEYQPRPGLPLSDNVADAMAKLQQMKEIYNGLPHIDCGSCGRPSCQAMAEEIVRGHGSVTDCIFKLREGIATLANKIVSLSESPLHTVKRKNNDENK
jgi:Na+-translocating ferredoxin:NAD+ oxidoreductase RNF subunit RnfB